MTPVVIMCGGRGLRLHPLTDKRPKPMLNVGGRPIIEQIMRRFIDQGFREFWLCVNYKKELIEEYFQNGSKFGCKVKYIHEPKPLGTAGALRLLPKWDKPYIVTNGDVLASIEYGKLMEQHAASTADATVCLGLYQHQVPFGVADFEEDQLIGFREKPIENFSVNAGVYVLEPWLAQNFRAKGAFDMTDLLEGKTLSAYAIEGYWCDVGNIEAYGHANADWHENIGTHTGPRGVEAAAAEEH